MCRVCVNNNPSGRGLDVELCGVASTVVYCDSSVQERDGSTLLCRLDCEPYAWVRGIDMLQIVLEASRSVRPHSEYIVNVPHVDHGGTDFIRHAKIPVRWLQPRSDVECRDFQPSARRAAVMPIFFQNDCFLWFTLKWVDFYLLSTKISSIINK